MTKYDKSQRHFQSDNRDLDESDKTRLLSCANHSNQKALKLMQATYFPDWQEKVTFSTGGPKPQILIENDKLKVIIGSLKAGQIIPAHPEALAVYHFLEGVGWMTVDDERYEVKSGATVITPQGAIRGIEAKTQLVFLAVRIA